MELFLGHNYADIKSGYQLLSKPIILLINFAQSKQILLTIDMLHE